MEKQNRKSTLFDWALLLAPLVVIALATVGSYIRQIQARQFFSDTNALASLPFYVGIVSNLGIVLWFSSAVLAFFTASLGKATITRAKADFLKYFGLISLLLFLDDLLMIHEQLPGAFPFLSEKKVYTVYLILMLFGMYRFRAVILASKYRAGFLSGLFFSLSILVDIGQERLDAMLGEFRIVFEDGFKFLGIVHWFGYFLFFCHREISAEKNNVR